MLSPSLSLTFSESIIIFRGFAKASAALHVLSGVVFASVLRSSAGWESGDVFGLAQSSRDPSVFGMCRWVSF